MEALTMSTYNTGVMSQKEAIAVRIITVVTLVYLPATFVSVRFLSGKQHQRLLNFSRLSSVRM